VLLFTFKISHQKYPAALAQLGERGTEDAKVAGSIPAGGKRYIILSFLPISHLVLPVKAL
jgi:hypothetical protein